MEAPAIGDRAMRAAAGRWKPTVDCLAAHRRTGVADIAAIPRAGTRRPLMAARTASPAADHKAGIGAAIRAGATQAAALPVAAGRSRFPIIPRRALPAAGSHRSTTRLRITPRRSRPAILGEAAEAGTLAVAVAAIPAVVAEATPPAADIRIAIGRLSRPDFLQVRPLTSEEVTGSEHHHGGLTKAAGCTSAGSDLHNRPSGGRTTALASIFDPCTGAMDRLCPECRTQAMVAMQNEELRGREGFPFRLGCCPRARHRDSSAWARCRGERHSGCSRAQRLSPARFTG